MEIDFSKPARTEDNLDRILKEGGEFQISFREDMIIRDLYNLATLLKDRSSWVKNIKITNRKEERERFRDKREQAKDFKPDFNFRKFPYSEETFIEILDDAIEATGKIDSSEMEKYGAEKITSEDIQNLFTGIFEEFKLYVKLASNIEDENSWREYSEKIWPMLDQETVKESLKRIENLYPEEEEEKNLDAKDLKQMWEEELERINVDYDVEIRETDGCFNIPEERTVVVARGDEEERFYSESEARILTMHELFHVVRAYNGFEAGKNDFPPILGIHTPFYDMTEEGGAIYREHATEVMTDEKEFDYHLRLLAAHYIHKELDFQEVVEKLMDHGGSFDRSVYLASRNREALRHHIYQGGYVEDWKHRDELWPLLIGKINTEWAEKLRKEIEADGMIKEPEIKPQDLFDYRFKI